MQLILASASPRRSELLEQIGVRFNVQPADIDETPYTGEDATTYVARMAQEKALSCVAKEHSRRQNRVHSEKAQDLSAQRYAVMGADTSVIVDGDILGKPADLSEAKAMLTKLSARTHQVITSVCLVVSDNTLTSSKPKVFSSTVITDVTFGLLSEAQIDAYWQTGEPQDKAGSYGIQGFGAIFVDHIKGSYSAVVGLPLTEVADMLNSAGILIWQQDN